jgi:predicted transposase YbfD/YdcC
MNARACWNACSECPIRETRAGLRHTLTSLLLTAMAAVLAGAQSFTAVGEWVSDAPPQVLAGLGIRRDPLAGRFEPPDEATIRRVLECVDASAFDDAIGSWLAGRLRAGDQRHERGRRARRALAVDGKAVRGTRHASSDGQAVHLLAVIDQQASAVLGQVSVDGKTSEITQFAPLLEPLDLAGCVITADALHTQREHAEFLLTSKHAHYILVVKKNQPSLYAQVKNLPWRNIPAGDRQHDRGHGRDEHRTLQAATVAAGICFPHAAQAIRVTRRIRPLSGQKKWRTFTIYAITSLTASQAAPAQLARWIRGHWHIEALHHPRRHLPRRRLPDPHRQRTPGHGHPAQPRHRHLQAGRAPEHRRRLPPPRPRRHPDPGRPRTAPSMTKTDITHYAGALCRMTGR